jgi:AbrB family looped-hinge helix DNA binding protein
MEVMVCMANSLPLYTGIARILMVKEFASTINSKGQVTIPAEVRRSLGVAPSDKVAFVIHESGTVELRRVGYSVADLRGILPALPDAKPLTSKTSLRRRSKRVRNVAFPTDDISAKDHERA